MAELPAKEERWRQLGYANHRDWRLAVEKQRRDAARAARIDSSLPNGAAPSPAGVASAPAPVVPTRKRRSNHPPSTTGVLCKWFDDHRRDPYPSPKEKGVLASNAGLKVPQLEKCAPRAPSRACGAPNAFMHVPSPWYRVYESKAAQLALSKRRRQAAARQGDDGKLVPRRRWQTADSSGSGPVTCE